VIRNLSAAEFGLLVGFGAGVLGGILAVWIL
jgi:hypothetical protein